MDSYLGNKLGSAALSLGITPGFTLRLLQSQAWRSYKVSLRWALTSADSFAVHPSTAENLDVSEEQVATGTNGIRVNGSSHIGLPFLLQDKHKCFRVYGLEVPTVYRLEERILLPGLRLLTPRPSPDPISIFPRPIPLPLPYLQSFVPGW
jgi:hypothetical protein